MRDLNPKAAADSRGSLYFKCLFSHLLILSVEFHIFLKIRTSNKKSTLKTVCTYPIMQVSRKSTYFYAAMQGRRLNHDQKVSNWLMQCKRIRCPVCSAKHKETRMKFKCRECNIGLCATPCFKVYQTKLHF
jgi:hypothetical protein